MVILKEQQTTMRLLISLLLFTPFTSGAQEGLKIGLEVAPSWVLNTHRNLSTGVRSSESGYGFNVGIPLKYGFSETTSFNSGITYEYIAFDNRVNNTLISSNRFGAINVPLILGYQLSSNWNFNGGVGFKYVFLSRAWSGFAVDISNAVNQIQPYVNIGVSTQSQWSSTTVEYGLNARFHPINIWESSAAQSANNTSKIVAFDLNLKFYLFDL